ncbi:MAG: Gfo/Idh/MocA family oxidoreductase [Pirellulaceae bacterium]|nr:Gfo/Idh/MocA family oxidoreductase [Thermoguttaceae bacterium]NLY99977.1 Gfo/Idh/MocA family oxidoreductase [Pirellulaceae bacterium]
MNTYRIGIIGFGFIGKVHAYGYRNLPLFYDPVPLEARITHVVTSRPETAEKARRVLDASSAATDYRAVTENPAIDIVHICTPNSAHKAALLSAIRQQKHIFCDKPLVASGEEADQVEAGLAGYRGIAQMTFHNRFFPAMIHARQLVEQEALGQVLQFRAAYLQSGSADPAAPLRWKLTAAGGGGAIADIGSHVLDAIDWLIGPFESFQAATQIAFPERPLPGGANAKGKVDAEDCVLAIARLKSGGVGILEASKIATGTEDELRLEIHGTRGALRFNLMDPHHLEFYDARAAYPPAGSRGWTRIDTGQRYDPPATSFPSPKAATGWLRGHVACLANFLRAVARGRPAEPDLRQGIRVQRWMEALRRSARDGRRIEV